LLCVVAAFFLKDGVTEKAMATEIDGQTITQMISGALPAEMASATEIVVPIIKALMNVMSFLLIFGVLQFLSWAIIYPICKIFVKKGEKKHGLVGGIIGTVQGVAVAFVMCVLLNGLFFNIGKVADTANSLGDSAGSVTASAVMSEGIEEGGDASQQPPQQTAEDSLQIFIDYQNSGICGIYNKVGNGVFNLVARTSVVDETTQEKKVITLAGQLDALKGVADMAKEMQAIQNIDFQNGIKGSANDIKAIFDKLDVINKGLSDESKDTINTLVQTVADGFELPVDLSVIDFKEIDFASEGEIITNLAEYSDKDPQTLTATDAENIVQQVVESNLILPLLESNNDLDLKLPEAQKAMAKDKIDELKEQGVAGSKINSLMNIFGLTDTASGN